MKNRKTALAIVIVSLLFQARAAMAGAHLSEARRISLISGAPVDLAKIIVAAAREHSVDARLVAAVALRESNFRVRAVSPVGARGVMQLMPRTAAWLGVHNAFDARENIFAGARYLKMLDRMFNGDLDLVLAAYNAGPANVRKHGGVPPFSETQAYVAKVRKEFERLRIAAVAAP